MPQYRLSKEVPWGDVLDILRWGVKFRMIQYKGTRAMLLKSGTDMELLSIELSMERKYLEVSLHAYQGLRGFLRYTTVTQLEKAAERLLDDSQK